MLTLSEAEHGVYHDRRVSDALHRHRIFDTTPMSLLPLTSPLILTSDAARFRSRVVDTAVVAVSERLQSW